MPSQESPSPMKRPSLTDRTSSTHSLSSSAKHQHKGPRTHLVGQRSHHGRNPSYGKNLNKLGRLTSAQNLHVEGHRVGHQKKRSGGHAVEPASPKADIRRNISQVSLPKTASQASLRKNHSTTSMPRNTSGSQLKKLGLAPLTHPKKEGKENTVGGFQLGDNSSEEEEAEWEDSSQSPHTTRQGSASSAVARQAQNRTVVDRMHSSPPTPALRDQHKSAPLLSRTQQQKSPSIQQDTEPPPLLQHNPRSSRAPPAMSSVSAFARPPSSTTLNRDGKREASAAAAAAPAVGPASVDVSHFVNGSIGANGTPMTPELGSDDDDYDSPSSFLPHYHPQAPPKSDREHQRSVSGLLNRPANATLPSRTQQRLELQRRETMRSPSVTQEPDTGDLPLALRTRSGSRGRARSAGNDAKAVRRGYELATSQLEVVKRFRNPVAEALNRLRELGLMQDGSGKGSSGIKDRPVSRAGSRKSMPVKSSVDHAQEQESKRNSVYGHGRPPSRGRVRFQRQGSHDDIGLSRSHGDEEVEEGGLEDSEGDAVSAEEALLRRMWESREVYEAT